jgi:hypothetical protein
MLTVIWARYRRRVWTSSGAVTARACQWPMRVDGDSLVDPGWSRVPRLLRVAFRPCNGVDQDVRILPVGSVWTAVRVSTAIWNCLPGNTCGSIPVVAEIFANVRHWDLTWTSVNPIVVAAR